MRLVETWEELTKLSQKFPGVFLHLLSTPLTSYNFWTGTSQKYLYPKHKSKVETAN